jgi:cystathionine beta-lyase/cystathionine gamma-synthase
MTNQDIHHDSDQDGFATRAIHVGSQPDPTTGAVIPPLSLSTTFAQAGVGSAKVSTLARTLLSYIILIDPFLSACLI